MKGRFRLFLTIGLVALGMALAGPAAAHRPWGPSRGYGYGYGYGAPRYWRPPPVVYRPYWPAPVWRPPVVVVAPPPVYYPPRPYVAPGFSVWIR